MQHPARPPADVAPAAVALIERLRARSLRVHCITNAVAQNFTANVLLAVGALPSMTLSPQEIGGFVAGADALLVNLGTFDAERRAATEIAVAAAAARNIPFVLDPVFIERSAARAEFARALLARGPKVVRLNHAEFTVLAGAEPSRAAAQAFAREHASVVALSGALDWVADGARIVEVANGHALMAKVTAMGCAGSALTAAALALEPDPLRAAAAALLMLGVAGEIAAERAQGPGSFAVAIIDALYRLTAQDITARAKVT